MKTRILLLMLLIFPIYNVANAKFGSGDTLFGTYLDCRNNFPSFFGEVDKIISNPSKTEFNRRGLADKLPRLQRFKDCLEIIDMMQADENLGGGQRLTTAVEHARIYIDSLATQEPPAATSQNEIRTQQ